MIIIESEIKKNNHQKTYHGFVVAPGEIGTKDNGQVGRSHLVHVTPANITLFDKISSILVQYVLTMAFNIFVLTI